MQRLDRTALDHFLATEMTEDHGLTPFPQAEFGYKTPDGTVYIVHHARNDTTTYHLSRVTDQTAFLGPPSDTPLGEETGLAIQRTFSSTSRDVALGEIQRWVQTHLE